MDVAWDEEFKDPFQVKLEVNGMDRSGFLSDIMAVLVDMKISANWVTARGKKNGGAVVDLVLEIKDLVQLEHIMNRIKRIKDVYDVKRVSFNGQPQNPLN